VNIECRHYPPSPRPRFPLARVLLAGVGLCGTLSYFVAMRRREIGVRLAMGARDREILSSFLRG